MVVSRVPLLTLFVALLVIYIGFFHDSGSFRDLYGVEDIETKHVVNDIQLAADAQTVKLDEDLEVMMRLSDFVSEQETSMVVLLPTSTIEDIVISTTTMIVNTKEPKEEYLALCLAIKNQSIDLPEWLQHYYYHMNVTRFYIMDDASDPPMSTSDTVYGIPKSSITFQYFTPDIAKSLPPGLMQLHIYGQCIERFGSQHTWMGFFDVDEFLDIRTSETLESILRSFEPDLQIGSLGINWKLHNSAGLLERPESVRKGLDSCWDTNLDARWDTPDGAKGFDGIEGHVKSIVRTKTWAGWITPHAFKSNNGGVMVGEDGKEASPGIAWRYPMTWHRLSLHHYVLKSKAEYQQKLDRWANDISNRKWDFWDKIEKHPRVQCTEMARYNP